MMMCKKVYIHTLTVSDEDGLYHFQVKLPQDAKRITAVQVTCTLRSDTVKYAGRLKMRTQKRRVLELDVTAVSPDKFITPAPGYGNQFFWQNGTKHIAQEVLIPVEETYLRCIYQELTGLDNYEVLIYLYYEAKT